MGVFARIPIENDRMAHDVRLARIRAIKYVEHPSVLMPASDIERLIEAAKENIIRWTQELEIWENKQK